MDAEDDPFGPLAEDASTASTPSAILMPAPAEPPPAPQIRHHTYGTAAQRWVYRDASGAPILAAARFNLKPAGAEKRKVVLPMAFMNGKHNGWCFGVPHDRRPLYGLDRLAEEPGAPVLVLEGEKTADAALSLFPDHVPVASQGGALAASKTDWTPLRGRKVTVWPDQDGPGRDYARDVVRLVKAAGGDARGVVAVPENWPSGWDVADPPPEGVTAETLAEMVDAVRPAGERQLTVLTPAQCEIGNPRPYVIKGLIARGDHGQFIGQPGSGKSALAPYAGYCVALGIPFFGLRVRQGRVLYLAAEDGHGMKLRVRALCKRLGDTSDFLLGPDSLNLMDPASGDLERVSKLIQEHQPAVVFIDTVARAFPGLRENDSDSMGRVVMVARQLAGEACRPAVMTVHHVAKDAGTTPRGHGILAGDLDVVVLVEGEKAEVRTIRLGKNRNGSSDASFAFNVEAEDFGEDEDGDLLTAPIAAPIDQGAAPGKSAKEAGLKDAPALMLREIRDLIDRYGARKQPGDSFPEVLSIARTLLRSRLIDRGWFSDSLLSKDEAGKTCLSRAGYGPENVALKALKRRGIVSHNRDHVWLV